MLQSRASAFVAAASIFTELQPLQFIARVYACSWKSESRSKCCQYHSIQAMMKARLIISPFPASLLHHPAPSQSSPVASLAGELHASRPCFDLLWVMLATSRRALGGRRVYLSHAWERLQQSRPSVLI